MHLTAVMQKVGNPKCSLFWDVKSPIYISERGVKPPRKILILMIKNKRFSLKRFINFYVQNSRFFMLRKLLVWYLVVTW